MASQKNETRSVENELPEEVNQIELSEEDRAYARVDWMKFCQADKEGKEVETTPEQDDDKEAAQFLQENEMWSKYITTEELEQIIQMLSGSEIGEESLETGPPEPKKQKLRTSSESKMV